MERSIAARRLGAAAAAASRPASPAARARTKARAPSSHGRPRPGPRAAARRARAGRSAPGWSERALRAFAAAALLALEVLRRRRRVRIAVIALALGAPLLGGGWMWLRDSSLVAVRHVSVTGVHGPRARAVERALTLAARRMSTLDVDRGALLAAVAPFHLVRAIEVSTSPPHGMRIAVSERLPVAALLVGETQTAVASDGLVLGPRLLSGTLPSVSGAYEPPAGRRLHDWRLLGALAILGAAPRALASLTKRVFLGPKGFTAVMRGGLEVYFGDSSRPHAKWLSLARVLADPTSAHALYVDVRTPERPAAGFAPGTAPTSAPGGGGTGSVLQQTSESITAALAAGLAASGGGGFSSGVQGISEESRHGGGAEAPASHSSSAAPAPSVQTSGASTGFAAEATAPATGG
jgi:cell division protein FtsQ